jgi:hypothetical protein
MAEPVPPLSVLIWVFAAAAVALGIFFICALALAIRHQRRVASGAYVKIAAADLSWSQVSRVIAVSDLLEHSYLMEIMRRETASRLQAAEYQQRSVVAAAIEEAVKRQATESHPVADPSEERRRTEGPSTAQ